jgi:hypothetical protein
MEKRKRELAALVAVTSMRGPDAHEKHRAFLAKALLANAFGSETTVRAGHCRGPIFLRREPGKDQIRPMT